MSKEFVLHVSFRFLMHQKHLSHLSHGLWLCDKKWKSCKRMKRSHEAIMGGRNRQFHSHSASKLQKWRSNWDVESDIHLQPAATSQETYHSSCSHWFQSWSAWSIVSHRNDFQFFENQNFFQFSEPWNCNQLSRFNNETFRYIVQINLKEICYITVILLISILVSFRF